MKTTFAIDYLGPLNEKVRLQILGVLIEERGQRKIRELHIYANEGLGMTLLLGLGMRFFF